MRMCAICGKGSVKSGIRRFLRSHYNPTGTVRKAPNLQWIYLPSGKRVMACVRCIKGLHKNAKT